jgi:hypothetical protein
MNGETSYLLNELCQRISSLSRQGGEKGRTKTEVDEVICWLTGYSHQALKSQLENKTSYEDFFTQAPRMNPSRVMITGVICGVRIETIEEPITREIRYLDKMIDELAKGKAMEKILRA